MQARRDMAGEVLHRQSGQQVERGSTLIECDEEAGRTAVRKCALFGDWLESQRILRGRVRGNGC